MCAYGSTPYMMVVYERGHQRKAKMCKNHGKSEVFASTLKSPYGISVMKE